MSGIPSVSTYIYLPGSGLEVPGLEAVLEYGDASRIVRDRIPGALLINDRSMPDQVHVTEISGLHDDPDGRDSRINSADRHGERAGLMLYGGRTIGLTGRVQSGNVHRMRDLWRRMRAQFGMIERDLLIHPPNEVVALVNQVPNPALTIDGTTWSAASTSGTLGDVTGAVTEGNIKAGTIAVASATGAGRLDAWVDVLDADTLTFEQQVATWNGSDDVWITARVLVANATGTVTSISLGLAEWANVRPGIGASSTFPVAGSMASQSSPATSTWYTLSIRVPASVLAYNTTHVTPQLTLNYGGAGSYTLMFTNVAMVFLNPGAATPLAYFDGDTAGHAWSGTAGHSASSGPLYAANQVPNATLEANVGWAAGNDAGVTLHVTTVPSKRDLHTDSGWSIYYDATSSASGQVVSAYTNVATPIRVVAGRTYKLYGRAKIVAAATGKFDAAIEWLDFIGLTISTSVQSIVVTNGSVIALEVSGVAPANAVQANIRFGWITDKSTAGGQDLRFFVGDLCLVDVTYYDPGRFTGYGDRSLEVAGAAPRRRIPRPFLVKGVRKTSDMKAPEQQTSLQARRPFTMSLRASDPRIYVLDERRLSLKLSGTPQFVSAQAEGYALETNPPTAPTGFTFQNQSGNLTNVGWTKGTTSPSRTNGGTTHANNGVGPDMWLVPAGSGANPDLNAPQTTDTILRQIRTAEGYAYANPRVVLGCSPTSRGDATSRGWNGAAVSGGGTKMLYNYVAIVLKAVSSTTWLELRWYPASAATANALYPGATNVHGAFELWCSHNASGTLGATRLQQWDYSGWTDNAHVWPLPFDPITTPMWLTAALLSNVVTWELWATYPSRTDFTSRRETNTYTLPAALQTLLGSTVIGNVGHSMNVGGVTGTIFDSGNWQYTASSPPFVHYFEAIKADAMPSIMAVPVIGNVDTPERITLRGDMVDPVVSMAVPNEDGTTQSTFAKLIGTMADTNPVTIDLDSGAITDSQGNNVYGELQPGGSFATLQPGINTITVVAANWDASAPEHVTVAWRDALA